MSLEMLMYTRIFFLTNWRSVSDVLNILLGLFTSKSCLVCPFKAGSGGEPSSISPGWGNESEITWSVG